MLGRLPFRRIIYTLNPRESAKAKSPGCDAGYELFLAVFLRRFYFTAFPVARARAREARMSEQKRVEKEEKS